MIAYFDTSALVPLVLREPSSAECARLWNESDAVASTALTYVEAIAALAMAERRGRLTPQMRERSLEELDGYWADVVRLRVDDQIVVRAAQVALRFGLRGYDAVHAVSAELLAGDDLVACAGDRALLVAWAGLGLTIRDTQGAVP